MDASYWKPRLVLNCLGTDTHNKNKFCIRLIMTLKVNVNKNLRDKKQ